MTIFAPMAAHPTAASAVDDAPQSPALWQFSFASLQTHGPAPLPGGSAAGPRQGAAATTAPRLPPLRGVVRGRGPIVPVGYLPVDVDPVAVAKSLDDPATQPGAGGALMRFPTRPAWAGETDGLCMTVVGAAAAARFAGAALDRPRLVTCVCLLREPPQRRQAREQLPAASAGASGAGGVALTKVVAGAVEAATGGFAVMPTRAFDILTSPAPLLSPPLLLA